MHHHPQLFIEWNRGLMYFLPELFSNSVLSISTSQIVGLQAWAVMSGL
jgi:hypothetical protein